MITLPTLKIDQQGNPTVFQLKNCPEESCDKIVQGNYLIFGAGQFCELKLFFQNQLKIKENTWNCIGDHG